MEEDFSYCFNQSWADIRGNVNLPARLSQCSGDLKLWARDRFNQLGRKIKVMQQELDSLMNSSGIRNNLPRIAEVERNIEKLSDQEEIFWKQWSRVNWLKHVDSNKKFFHAIASTRQKRI